MSPKGVVPLDVSKDNLLTAFEGSNSIGDILVKLNIACNSRNYNRLRETCRVYNLEIPKTKHDFIRKPLEEILVRGSFITSNDLKKRLLSEGLLEDICSECNQLPWWNNKPLVLQLDHINGERTDNRLENLRILCPNCHTQTETYCGKKSLGGTKPRVQKTYKRPPSYCECGEQKAHSAALCRACRKLQPVTKIE